MDSPFITFHVHVRVRVHVSATDIRDALGRVLEHNEFSDASPALAYSGSWGRATATIRKR